MCDNHSGFLNWQLRSETGNAGLKEMELQDFVESPRFPLRRTISTSSTDIDSLEGENVGSLTLFDNRLFYSCMLSCIITMQALTANICSKIL